MLGLGAVSLWVNAGTATSTRPNIVVIMADDLSVGFTRELIKLGMMPNLVHYLRDEGISFTGAFVTNSLCCPSRATFLTGQYSHNTSVLTNVPPLGGITRFNDRQTIATWLKAAGYRTGYVGKYLNGYGTADHNHDGSFDALDLRYVPPGWDDWQVTIDTWLDTYRVYDYRLNDNGTLVLHGSAPADYQTDVLSARARDFIAEAESIDDTPFFLALMPLAPHVEVWPEFTKTAPYQESWKWFIRPAPRHAGTVTIPVPLPPSFNEIDISDKPMWMHPGAPRARPIMNWVDYLYLTRQYRSGLESLRAVDDMIGEIFDALSEHGELDNTVVIFTSDNGYLHGEHRMAAKFVAYEESIRVPLYVRVPGSVSPREIDALVLNNDLAPTIAELAGASPGLIADGRSLVPLLNSEATTGWRDKFLVEHWNSGTPDDVPSYAALRARWPTPGGPLDLLYVEHASPDEDGITNIAELYNMSQDPYQLQNLIPLLGRSGAALVQSLATMLHELAVCAGAGCRDLEQGPAHPEIGDE
ncbi:MAG: sulfatase [Acidimicrobiia bacterium]|nr:sulfatase [Acidimicrobiia bacterium]